MPCFLSNALSSCQPGLPQAKPRYLRPLARACEAYAENTAILPHRPPMLVEQHIGAHYSYISLLVSTKRRLEGILHPNLVIKIFVASNINAPILSPAPFTGSRHKHATCAWQTPETTGQKKHLYLRRIKPGHVLEKKILSPETNLSSMIPLTAIAFFMLFCDFFFFTFLCINDTPGF